MKALLFAVSEGAAIDQETNALSVFNVIDEITSVGLPLLIPKVVITLIVECDEEVVEEVKGSIVIMNNDNEIHNISADIRFSGAPKARLRVTVGGLPVHESGKLIFKYLGTDPTFTAELAIKVSEPTAPSDGTSEE